MVEVNARETWAKAMRHIENIVFAPTNDVGQKKVIWDHGKTMLLQNLVEVTKRFNPDPQATFLMATIYHTHCPSQ